MLDWTIYVTFAGLLLMLFLPTKHLRVIRSFALLTALAGLAFAIVGFLQYDPKAGVVTIKELRWIPTLGAKYFIAADGISITLALLTGIAAVAGVLFSWNIEYR